MISDMKRCSSCKQWLDETEFNRNRTKHDGLQSRCRACQWTIKYWSSLDAPLASAEDATLHDILAAREAVDDETMGAVLMVFERWVSDKWMTQNQADYVLLHAVDRLSFNEIGRLLMKSDVTVKKAYHKGVEKLWKRYVKYGPEVMKEDIRRFVAQ